MMKCFSNFALDFNLRRFNLVRNSRHGLRLKHSSPRTLRWPIASRSARAPMSLPARACDGVVQVESS
jgi:hypothetical protein